MRDRFLIEGVRNGDFEAGDFAATDCVFGTGAIFSAGSVLFVSCVSTTDYLHYQLTEKGIVASNSLPLLLSHIDDLLDPYFTGYPRINDTITKRINDFIREIPTRKFSFKQLI